MKKVWQRRMLGVTAMVVWTVVFVVVASAGLGKAGGIEKANPMVLIGKYLVGAVSSYWLINQFRLR